MKPAMIEFSGESNLIQSIPPFTICRYIQCPGELCPVFGWLKGPRDGNPILRIGLTTEFDFEWVPLVEDAAPEYRVENGSSGWQRSGMPKLSEICAKIVSMSISIAISPDGRFGRSSMTT